VVSNHKIKRALGKPLPLTSSEGLRKTFRSFSSNAYSLICPNDTDYFVPYIFDSGFLHTFRGWIAHFL